MRRRQNSLVTRRQGSPYYYENFTVGGYRFRGCLDTDNKDEAEIIAAKKRSDALLGKLTGKKPELSLDQALGQYWLEHGQFLVSAADIKRMGRTLIGKDGLGKTTPLSDINSATLSTYAAIRRKSVSNRSVNIELEHLRAVLRRAKKLWGVAVPEIEWPDVLLEEAGEREHVLSRDEELRLFAALRPDFHAMFRFALITGIRLNNIVELTWTQIDFTAQVITLRVKSKKPGGELHRVPITRAVNTILEGERGRHPQRVFTYICNRSRHDPRRKMVQRKGERYPFTHDGWRKVWKDALDAAGVEDFRFHDFRHTAGTRTLHAHRNLKTVQRMLGHKDIATTLRYTRSDIDDVREAMETTAALSPAAEVAKPRIAAGRRKP